MAAIIPSSLQSKGGAPPALSALSCAIDLANLALVRILLVSVYLRRWQDTDTDGDLPHERSPSTHHLLHLCSRRPARGSTRRTWRSTPRRSSSGGSAPTPPSLPGPRQRASSLPWRPARPRRSASSHSSSACPSRTSSALQLQGAVMLKYNKRHAAMWAEAVTGGVIMWREQPKRLYQAWGARRHVTRQGRVTGDVNVSRPCQSPVCVSAALSAVIVGALAQAQLTSARCSRYFGL